MRRPPLRRCNVRTPLKDDSRLAAIGSFDPLASGARSETAYRALFAVLTLVLATSDLRPVAGCQPERGYAGEGKSAAGQGDRLTFRCVAAGQKESCLMVSQFTAK
jgi:hypothetical protein